MSAEHGAMHLDTATEVIEVGLHVATPICPAAYVRLQKSAGC
jgi:hypothetical protein